MGSPFIGWNCDRMAFSQIEFCQHFVDVLWGREVDSFSETIATDNKSHEVFCRSRLNFEIFVEKFEQFLCGFGVAGSNKTVVDLDRNVDGFGICHLMVYAWVS